MKIIVNGAPRQVQATTLAEAVRELGYGGARVATARGGEFIPAAQRETCPLREGDVLEILLPMRGG